MIGLSIFAYRGGHWSGHDLNPFEVTFLVLALIFGIATAIYFREK